MHIKNYILSLFLLLLVVISSPLCATHMMGSDISYKCLGNNKYEVTLTVYRDCNGLNVANLPVTARCNTVSKNFMLQLISKTDVTNINPDCSYSSRCSGNYRYGIEENVFRGVIDLNDSIFNCCEITLSWQQCCRSSDITTGGANANFHTQAIINKCLSTCNNSPSIGSKPAFILSVGEDFEFKNNMFDTTDGDSLSFKLVDPLTANGSAIQYLNLWSAQKPISYLGFPSSNGLVAPAGFYFNSSTGDMKFRPMVKDESTILAIEVTEWRKINGVAAKVGVTRREMMIIVDANNNKPKATFEDRPGEIAVCKLAGTLCKDIPLLRPKGYNDTVELVYSHNLQNISFTNIGSFSNPVVRVCYTPTTAEINANKPLTFSIKATVNSCPFKGVSEKVFTWVERPPLPDSFAINKTLNCKSLDVSLINNSSTIANINTRLQVKANNFLVSEHTPTLQIENLKDSGWHYIKMEVESYNHCTKQEYKDSIYLPLSNFLEIEMPKDTFICNSTNLSIPAKTINGNSPFSYTWSGDDTSSKLKLSTAVKKPVSIYSLKVIDAKGCIASDTINVKYFNPTATLTGTTTACSGDTATIKAHLKDTIKPVFGWVGFAQGKPDIKLKVTQNSQLAFTIKDSSGCNVLATHFIRVYAPKANYTHNTVYCESDSIVLEAVVSGGLAPYNIQWQPFNKTGNTVELGMQKKGSIEFTTIVKDDFGCTDTQHQTIRVNATPDIKLLPLPTVCETEAPLQLNSYAQPQKGVWKGEGVTNNYFRPQATLNGEKELTYYYLDSLSFCDNQAKTTIKVHTQPVASFSVDSLKANKQHSFIFTNQSRYGKEHNFLWEFGDVASGANNTSNNKNPQHQFSDTGKYTIKLTINGGVCPLDSITKHNYVSVMGQQVTDSSNVSVNELYKPTSIVAYPNPTRGSLTIESEITITALSIADSKGKQVYFEIVGDKETKINISNLKAGIYLLSVSYKDKVEKIAIVKQ